MHKNILLVEGITDKSFFDSLCKHHNLNAAIKVTNPSDIKAANYNTKQGAIQLLDLLVLQLIDGSLEKLSIVVDCDVAAHGGGLANTINQIGSVLKPHGYSDTPKHLKSAGFYFENNDGLPQVGLWVMPDNKSEGAIEEWLSSCIEQSQRALYDHAKATVQALPNKLFPPIRQSKAVIATWLAWQQVPGCERSYTVKNNLLDSSAVNYDGLIEWLTTMFK